MNKNARFVLASIISLPFIAHSPAFAGVVSGTGTVTGYFDNPITIPGSVYTGIGTNTIEWGTPFNDSSFTNQLSFTPFNFTDQPKFSFSGNEWRSNLRILLLVCLEWFSFLP